jgi:phage terminase large subunit-like protein
MDPKIIQAQALAFANEQMQQRIPQWNVQGRPEQNPPEGDWSVWAYIAGRGAGKTRSGSEWVHNQVLSGSKRIALVAPTSADG